MDVGHAEGRGRLVADRGWSDYGLGKADSQEHLKALDEVYVVTADGRVPLSAFSRYTRTSADDRISRPEPWASIRAACFADTAMNPFPPASLTAKMEGP